LCPRPLLSYFDLKFAGAIDFPSIEAGDDVADLEASARTRRVRFDLADDCALVLLHLEEVRVLRGDVGDAHAHVGMRHLAVADERVDGRLGELRGNREAKAGEATRL